jgi:hypothetical protein
MKTIKIQYLWGLAVILGLSIYGCNKETTTSPNTSSGITKSDIATAQDAEAQDAVISQVEQDADNTMDDMEANNFTLSSTKSASDCATVEISPKDTFVFPKTITITYNCMDTVNGDYMTQTGQIVIVVDTIPVGKKLPWRAHLRRTLTFNDFSVSTDSSSFTINGTRTLFRERAATRVSNSYNMRVEVKDSIVANLSIAIKNGSDNFTVTRIANRTREAIRNYSRLTMMSGWRAGIIRDSVIYNGTISGVNAMGNNYSRTITSPVIFTRCPYWPYNQIIPTGTIQFVNGANTCTISYAADGCKTIITLEKNGQTKTIERRIGRKFYRWW